MFVTRSQPDGCPFQLQRTAAIVKTGNRSLPQRLSAEDLIYPVLSQMLPLVESGHSIG